MKVMKVSFVIVLVVFLTGCPIGMPSIGTDDLLTIHHRGDISISDALPVTAVLTPVSSDPIKLTQVDFMVSKEGSVEEINIWVNHRIENLELNWEEFDILEHRLGAVNSSDSDLRIVFRARDVLLAEGRVASILTENDSTILVDPPYRFNQKLVSFHKTIVMVSTKIPTTTINFDIEGDVVNVIAGSFFKHYEITKVENRLIVRSISAPLPSLFLAPLRADKLLEQFAEFYPVVDEDTVFASQNTTESRVWWRFTIPNPLTTPTPSKVSTTWGFLKK